MKIEHTEWTIPIPKIYNKITSYVYRFDEWSNSPSEFKSKIRYKYGNRWRITRINGIDYIEFLSTDTPYYEE
jgi:hypothetical protein